MKLTVKNTEQGLIPLYNSDLDEKKKLKLGKVYEADVKDAESRNYQFLKKFMALIRIGHENTKEFEGEIPFKVYRKWATVKAGHYDIYKTSRGKMVEAKSLAFENMDEIEFQQVYNDVIQVIMNDIGASKETIEQELLNFL